MEINRLVGGAAVWVPRDSSLIWSLWALSGSITGPICESGCVALPLSLLPSDRIHGFRAAWNLVNGGHCRSPQHD